MANFSMAANGAKVYVSQKDFRLGAGAPTMNPKFAGQLYVDTFNKILYCASEPDMYGKQTWIQLTSNKIQWVDVNGKPTTLNGYGITDVYTKDEVSHLIAMLQNQYAAKEHSHQTMLDSELNNILNDVFK